MFCRTLKSGCHLASIHSYAESADLAEYLTDYLSLPYQVWIGLNKPQNLCVHMWSPAGFLKWNDTLCEAWHPFICQCKY
ncbi:PREDICTED: C-type lectin BfL-2-like [Thamnophis sirtalis]|uniref:C-type lectin BfL-2-like n=1 Tax=Thamnophis sirtalis TaxID=35019 RepID=A0A6I9Z6X0_9SAUR|nr:PREDICTED: C-type lectin BfL-2-like [Thamnophis sirtalis]